MVQVPLTTWALITAVYGAPESMPFGRGAPVPFNEAALRPEQAANLARC